MVRWHKRQFACRERLCKRKAFTESIAELPPYARITGRTRRAAGASIGSGRSVRAVCGGLPMSWPTAHAAFVDHAKRLLTEPTAPEVLGIDETQRGRPRWSKNEDGSWSRLERFETSLVDLSGSGGLLGQTAGRTSKTVVAWLDERGEDWKARVRLVAIDPCAAYRSAVEHALPHARVIADHFHLDRLAGEMVTDVRQRVFREQLGLRGRKNDPAWANRRLLLLRAGVRLSAPALDQLSSIFTPSSDPTGEIGAAWGVKERFRMLLAATDRSTIADRLHRFHETVLAADLPEANPARSDCRRLVARDPRVPGNPHHQRRHRRHQPPDQRRHADRFRVSQPRQPTPPRRFHCTRQSRRTPVPRRPFPLNFEEPVKGGEALAIAACGHSSAEPKGTSVCVAKPGVA